MTALYCGKNSLGIALWFREILTWSDRLLRVRDRVVELGVQGRSAPLRLSARLSEGRSRLGLDDCAAQAYVLHLLVKHDQAA